MKVAVISNCQHRSIAVSIRTFIEDANVSSINMGELTKSDETIKEWSDITKSADLTIVHPQAKVSLSEKGIDFKPRKELIIPGVVFAGLQPDITYIRWEPARRGLIQSAIGDYHSAIAAAAYLEGFDPNQAKILFNKIVYSRLGYTTAYDESKKLLISLFQKYGIDIASSVERWQSSGRAFMFSLNHPCLFVMADIVRAALLANNIPHNPKPDPNFYFQDPLLEEPIFPVYPELGLPHGISGPYLFKTTVHANRLYSLQGFLERSYEIYSEWPKEAFNAEPMVSRTREVIAQWPQSPSKKA